MLDRQDVVGQEVLAGQGSEAALRVQGIGRQDPAGEGEPLVQVQQHRPDFRDLVRLGGDLPFGEHDPAGRCRQQEQAGPVAADGAADLLPVAGQRRLRGRPGHRESDRARRHRRREIAGHGVREGLRAGHPERPGHRLPARCMPHPVPARAGAGGGQVPLAGIPDPRGDAGELRLAVQHGHHHQCQDARQGVPAPAPGALVRDAREAARDAPAGRVPQLRRSPQQRRPRPLRLRAQPAFLRPASFPQFSGFPVPSGLPVPPCLLFSRPPPLPRFLPLRGPADDFLRPRDHRLGRVSGDGHAKLVTQRGLRRAGDVRYPLSYPGPRCPAREVAGPQ